MPLGHRDIANVRRPGLVRPLDGQVPEQVWVYLVPLPRLARSPPWIRALKSIRRIRRWTRLRLTLYELVAHPPPVERPLQVNLVDESHQRQIRLADRLGMVERARARNVEQLAPPRLGQPMLCVNLRPALAHRSRPRNLDKKSFCQLTNPWSFSTSFSLCWASTAFPPNTSSAPSTRRFFQS